jgi:O-antigen chain-terminating methyltransferase
MLDVKNPQIRVDELIERIQEEVRARRKARTPTAGSTAPISIEHADWRPLDEAFARAQRHAAVGVAVPAMKRLAGLKRAVAAQVAKGFLRVAQLITRDQREFNLAALQILRALTEAPRDFTLQIAALRAELTAARATIADLQARMDKLDGEEARERIVRTASSLGELRTSLSMQERRLEVLLQEAQRRMPEPFDTPQVERIAAESPHVWDATYLHFEDEFRGSRDEIQRRVAIYVPKFRAAEAGTEASPILDVGCGRGELLEVLRQEGLVAFGVDTNGAAIEQCRARGLKVEMRDGFEALRAIPDGSLGGIAALHVVEHLPFELMLKLIDEALRVLRPGGVAIFETPNPTNVLVGSSNFYIDPTHRNPVHPKTLRHLMEARGLIRVETLMLHPLGAEVRLPEGDSELARRFNEYFYGPQDYAIVGHRA